MQIFWQMLEATLGYFIFQHLVTLVASTLCTVPKDTLYYSINLGIVQSVFDANYCVQFFGVVHIEISTWKRSGIVALKSELEAVWPDWAIYSTLGKFLKPLATINLPKSPTSLDNFWKGVKMYNFSNAIVCGQLLYPFANFFLVTLVGR